MSNSRVLVIFGIILAAAFSRILPHPGNFSPILALALFGGAKAPSRSLAVLIVFFSMLLSDIVIGSHVTLPFVYISLFLTVLMGGMLKANRGLLPLGVATLTSAVLFFVVTNFGVWMFEGLYAHNGAGLIACYVAGIPFFQSTVASSVLFVAILFGGFALLERGFPALRSEAQSA